MSHAISKTFSNILFRELKNSSERGKGKGGGERSLIRPAQRRAVARK